MENREHRNLALICSEEDAVGKTTKQGPARFRPKRLISLWGALNLVQAAGELDEEALAEAGPLSFVPGVSITNVRLRFGPDD